MSVPQATKAVRKAMRNDNANDFIFPPVSDKSQLLPLQV
jgi:hypothetical protein